MASADGESLFRQLYAMNIESGEVRELCTPPTGTGEEENYSLEEKLRRERARQLHTGITSYAWAEGAEGIGQSERGGAVGEVGAEASAMASAALQLMTRSKCVVADVVEYVVWCWGQGRFWCRWGTRCSCRRG